LPRTTEEVRPRAFKITGAISSSALSASPIFKSAISPKPDFRGPGAAEKFTPLAFVRRSSWPGPGFEGSNVSGLQYICSFEPVDHHVCCLKVMVYVSCTVMAVEYMQTDEI
jgi:hypothetical protein